MQARAAYPHFDELNIDEITIGGDEEEDEEKGIQKDEQQGVYDLESNKDYMANLNENLSLNEYQNDRSD